jgi:hypothetical protein
MRTLGVSLFATALAFGTSAVSAPAHAESKLAQIREKIEGIYELVEWNDNGVIHKPPQATGRMYEVNGNHFWMAHNETANGSVDYFGTGRYKITENTYSYGYDEEKLVSKSGSNVQLIQPHEAWGKDLVLPHMRTFDLKFENGVVKDEPVDKSIHASGIWDGESYIYTDNDKHQVRTYKRIK